MDKYLGKRLDGRYEMRELIGVGGMAYVYKAYDAVDDRIVAVKILKDEFLNSEEFVRRFRNESKAIAILNHPNIVKVLDVGFGERLQYIVMEYIDGITLKEYLDQRKDIRWKEAVHFTVQILRALQHAHDKGIVHRDIKPQNIMLLSDGTIKVTDFGIARLNRNEMKATVDGNKAIGSVHYISPEQARGEITDEKTDLYAVGIMLYETLTGRLPFEADNAVSVAIMQMQSEAKAPHLINGEIPEGLEQITLKAMQKDTAKRYQSAAEMLSDFDEFKRNPSIKFEYTYMVDETPTRYVDAITRVRGEGSDPKAKKEDSVAEKKDSKNKKTISLVVILLVVAAAAVGVMVWFISGFFNGRYVKKAEDIPVELFVGMSYIEDIKNNADYNSRYEFEVIMEDANDPTRAVGEVFKQSPRADAIVKKGAKITLYVNNGTPDDVTLEFKLEDEIREAHRDQVRKLLQDKGLRVKEVEVSDENVPKDHVIGISLNYGQSYPYDTLVTVTVSSGPSEQKPIDFPPILGLSHEQATEILTGRGFTGQIEVRSKNYTGNNVVEEGKVMAVAIGGQELTEMPETIIPDGTITLVVSTGLKDVSLKLAWPEMKVSTMMIDVRVKVNGKVSPEFSQQFVGYTPQDTTDAFAFNVTTHPTKEPYLFVVEIKKHGAYDDDYAVYTKLRVNPVTGVVTMELPYQSLPGITPDPTTSATLPTTGSTQPSATVSIPMNYHPEGKEQSVVKAELEALGLIVEAKTQHSSEWEAGKVICLVSGGKGVVAGMELEVGSVVTMYVSSGTDGGDATSPTNPTTSNSAGSTDNPTGPNLPDVPVMP